MSDISTIIAELEALQEYEVYEPIVRYLAVSALTLYAWDFGAQRLYDLQQLII
ncbi:hypothetical protein K503DRAFT_806104 [Rhizopogon vinicolor AM-OR11-026]|uniref:Uncharacterized protein n=1 Tax=Rhizopogon vinicolor AM-OR11-026 TaxID=1314800 RepID=A0A1B7MFJ5_9AGAM|nr:hypothetical protein K503DRAFT_806104 [Rhizopogon vinicolor AM-OR11-026]